MNALVRGTLTLASCLLLLVPSPLAQGEAREPDRAQVPTGREALRFTPLEADPELTLSNQENPYPAIAPPKRPRPLLELGDPFLGNGPIARGYGTLTDQYLQPWFLVYGTYRTAFQTNDQGSANVTEWANRLDLHANLSLSGTERIVASMRPLDSDRGSYSGYNFHPSEGDGWQEEFNPALTALFFEGELGEIFPGIDPEDRQTLDVGFSIGRQPLVVQEGVLIDDDIDLFGITRNSLIADGVSNLRITGIFGWNEINRGHNREEESNLLFGVLTAADVLDSTIALDALYVLDEDDLTDAWYFGGSSTQRIGKWNTTFRAAASLPVHGETEQARTGAWVSSEVSRTLDRSDDIVYANTFWNIDHFRAAALGDDRGGAASHMGMLFEPVGMGRYRAPLGNDLDDTLGFSLGYQSFLSGTREHALIEISGTESTEGPDAARLGLGTRYQRAIGQHHVMRLDAFALIQESDEPEFGLRLEWRIEF